MLLSKIDFHIHPWEVENQIEKFLLEYAKRSFRKIAFTDHYEFSFKDSRRFAKEREEVERLKSELGLDMQIFISSEIACLDKDGKLECDDNPSALKDLDYISAAPHHYTKEQFAALGDGWAQHAQEMLLALAKRPDVLVILHPFVHIRDQIDRECKFMLKIPSSFHNQFAKLAKENNKVVEVHRNMTNYFLPLIEELMKQEVWLVVGSDAHSLPEIEDSRAAVELIKRINPDYPFIGLGPCKEK